MRKRKFTKFGIIIVGLAIVGMLMFSFPLMGATEPLKDAPKVEDSIKEGKEDLDEVNVENEFESIE